MIDEYGVMTRRRWTRRSMWFMLAGFVVILFDIATINWTLTLPQEFGKFLWAGVFTFGVMLIVLSPGLERIAPSPLSKAHAEQVDWWEKSGSVATMVSDVSSDETRRIVFFARRHFGKFVIKTVTARNAKVWTFKEFRVGSKTFPAGLSANGPPLFNMILYRRDLARQKGVRRPWRTLSPRDGSLQLIRSCPLIELPNWVTD